MESEQLKAVITEMVDSSSVANILDSLSEVCEETAKECVIDENVKMAKYWLQAAHKIANVKVRV